MSIIRQGTVLVRNITAGTLQETDIGYLFQYDPAYLKRPDASAVSLTLGYTFDSDGFGAEAGAIAAVMAEKLPMLNAGMVSDVDTAADELVKALEQAGINDAIKANQEQLDAFLANK